VRHYTRHWSLRSLVTKKTLMDEHDFLHQSAKNHARPKIPLSDEGAKRPMSSDLSDLDLTMLFLLVTKLIFDCNL
jgi:hypothetical protein